MKTNRIYNTLLTVALALVFQAVVPALVYAGYSITGVVTSENLLAGSSASSITGFYYDLALLPGDSSVTIQFSKDNTTWYSAAGVLGGSTALSTIGGATVDLTALGWTSSYFYYKFTLNATSDLTGSPVVESVRLEYVPDSGYDGSFVVNQSGTVGIGVSNSAYKLDVAGDVNVANGNALLFSGSRVLKGDTANGSVYMGGIDSNITTAYLQTAGVNRLTITSSGNVGVGTTLPLSKMGVLGNLAVGATYGAMAAPTSGLIVEGNVGIGTTSPQTKLQVAGVIAPSLDNTYTLGNATYRFSEVYAANGVINTSDERLKDNIATLTYGLDAINGLNPVSFAWKDNPEQGSKLGLLAQDVQLVIPEIVVRGDDPNHTLGIRYTELIPVLIRAIQELSQKVEALATQTFDTLFAKTIVVENIAADRGHFSEEIQTDGRLCVGSACVTEAEFLQMVLQAKQAPVTEPAPSSASDPHPTSESEAPADESVPSAQSESEEETVVTPTEPDESSQSAETENVETPAEEQNDTATIGANTESTPDDTAATTTYAPTEELDPKEEPAEQEDSGNLPETDTSNS